MAQQNIDFGTFPDDPDADAIRTAFQKVQNNFSELYSATSDATVTSVNRSAGAGIQVNSPTGNVIVTANIACVQVSTSTLSIGRDGNGGTSASITQSSQTLVIDLPATISTSNIVLTGNANIGGYANVVGNANVGNLGTAGLITATGNVTGGNLTTSGVVSATGNVSGGNLNASGIVSATGNIIGGNVYANSGIIGAQYLKGDGSNITGIVITNGNSNIVVTANGNINMSVAGNSNIFRVTGTGANITGYAIVTGNISAGNVSATTFTGALSGAATSATTAGTVTTAAQPNITSVGTLTSLTTTTITTGANITAGTITGNWSLSAGSQLRATYADLAEYYAGDANIEPGTVVEFGGNQEVQVCNSFMSTLVAGIVTTNPAYLMNSNIDCEFPVAIALQGRVPVKVIGPVKRGDLMVSTNNGHIISCSSPNMGSVLGKALTDFNGEIGIIEIMVGRT